MRSAARMRAALLGTLLRAHSGQRGRAEQQVALAVYGAAALLNHACAPSVALAFDGGALTVRALRRHAPGERLLHCYGPQARALTAKSWDRYSAGLPAGWPPRP